jgi:hypothetical protein
VGSEQRLHALVCWESLEQGQAVDADEVGVVDSAWAPGSETRQCALSARSAPGDWGWTIVGRLICF